MFGKRYFAIRERLAEVVLGVGQLARKCGGEILDPVTDEGGGGIFESLFSLLSAVKLTLENRP